MTDNGKCLVVGFGSIGQRHARVLRDIGLDVAIVTRADPVEYTAFRTLEQGLAEWQPEYVVIANDTRLHAGSLQRLAQLEYRGITLVEKPLAATVEDLGALPRGPVYVGYCLRFHPLIQNLIDLLEGERVWTFFAYVGQYLPTWRAQGDYRHSYSARAGEGGAIRDLSHELDYAQFLLGQWRRAVVAGGQYSDLEIESEDAASIIIECDRCPLVTIHVNYLDRTPARWIRTNGSFGTVWADLVAGKLAVNDEEKSVIFDRDEMYRRQHLAALANDTQYLCKRDQAMYSLSLVDAAHRSMRESRWISAAR